MLNPLIPIVRSHEITLEVSHSSHSPWISRTSLPRPSRSRSNSASRAGASGPLDNSPWRSTVFTACAACQQPKAAGDRWRSMKIDEDRWSRKRKWQETRLVKNWSPAKYLGFPVFVYSGNFCGILQPMFPEAARSATREKGEGGGLAETNFFASSRLPVGDSRPTIFYISREEYTSRFSKQPR